MDLFQYSPTTQQTTNRPPHILWDINETLFSASYFCKNRYQCFTKIWKMLDLLFFAVKLVIQNSSFTVWILKSESAGLSATFHFGELTGQCFLVTAFSSIAVRTKVWFVWDMTAFDPVKQSQRPHWELHESLETTDVGYNWYYKKAPLPKKNCRSWESRNSYESTCSSGQWSACYRFGVTLPIGKNPQLLLLLNTTNWQGCLWTVVMLKPENNY